MLKTAHLRCLVHPLAVFWWAIRSDGWKQRLYQRWGLERGQSKGAKRGQKMMFSFLVLSDFEHLSHYWQITEKIVVVAVASSLTSMIRGSKFEDLLWNIPDWLSVSGLDPWIFLIFARHVVCLGWWTYCARTPEAGSLSWGLCHREMPTGITFARCSKRWFAKRLHTLTCRPLECLFQPNGTCRSWPSPFIRGWLVSCDLIWFHKRWQSGKGHAANK